MAGINAFGVVLEREDTAGSDTFTAVANIVSLTGPGMERDQLDVTDHGSPGQWEESIPGIKRSGEVELELHYDPTEHDVLLDDWSDGLEAVRGIRIVWPDAMNTVWAFDAYLMGFEPEAPHDDKLTATATYKLTGEPDFDADGGS